MVPNRSLSLLPLNKKSSPHVEKFFRKSKSFPNLGMAYTQKALEEFKRQRKKEELHRKKKLEDLNVVRSQLEELQRQQNERKKRVGNN